MTFECTENDISRIRERIKIGVFDNDGCEIWHGKIPRTSFLFDDNVRRYVCLPRFVVDQTVTPRDSTTKVTRKCGRPLCLKREHLDIENSKDHKFALERIMATTTPDENGCLKNKTAYSKTTLGNVTMFRHQIVFIIANNNGEPIPKYNEAGEPMVIRHTCNEPKCLNPEHLKLGTRSENSYDDRKEDDTLLIGDRHPRSKLTKEKATKIKHSQRDPGDPEYMTRKERADHFDVTVQHVYEIDKNNSWAHIPDRNGDIYDNSSKRKRNREHARNVRMRQWEDQDFLNAGNKIRENIMESDEGKRVDIPGMCWIWQKSFSAEGYGVVTFKGRQTRSHILSCEVKNMRRATEGEVVRHLCANPVCCNPGHLCFGTNKDNMRDAILLGESKNYKLIPEDVRKIRTSTKTNIELAKEYGVCKENISLVRRGKSWKYIE